MKYLLILLSSIILFACNGGQENGEIDDLNESIDSIQEIDSLAYFNERIKENPRNSQLYYKRAMFTLGLGRLMSAKADLEQAMRLDSLNLDARLLYGNIQLSLTHVDTSRFHYDFILRHDSANTGAMLGMSKIYALLNDKERADGYISALLRVDQYNAEAYFMRGIIYRSDYYETNRQDSWDRAMSSFQTAVEQDPDYYSAYVEMGVMQDEKGSELALEYYNSALDIFPESTEALYNVGMYHQKRGELNEAIDAYKRVIEIDSLWADPYYNQGYIHLIVKDGNLDSAIFYLSKATECDPDYYQAYNNLGLAYETKGDIENAKKFYSRAIEVNPDFQLAKDNLNSLKR